MFLLKLLTAACLLWLRGWSGEEQAHCSASKKSFDFINGGGISTFCQK